MDRFVKFLLVFEAGIQIHDAGSPNELLFQNAAKSGFSDIPEDAGGPTMCGITLNTYRQFCKRMGYPSPSADELRNIPFGHWEATLRYMFWNPCHADELPAPLAYIIVDWFWASGFAGLKRVQRILSVKQDGIFGPVTVAAILSQTPESLFNKIKEERLVFLDEIVKKRPANIKFLKGWQNRLNAINYDGLILRNPPL